MDEVMKIRDEELMAWPLKVHTILAGGTLPAFTQKKLATSPSSTTMLVGVVSKAFRNTAKLFICQHKSCYR